jgi:hypothetical protein
MHQLKKLSPANSKVRYTYRRKCYNISLTQCDVQIILYFSCLIPVNPVKAKMPFLKTHLKIVSNNSYSPSQPATLFLGFRLQFMWIFMMTGIKIKFTNSETNPAQTNATVTFIKKLKKTMVSIK